MHPADRVPFGLLGCVGAVTAAATLALAVAAFPGRPWLGFAIGSATCLGVAAPVLFGLRRARLHARLEPTPRAPGADVDLLTLDVPDAGVLRADALGLRIPLALLTRQAARRAREAGEDDVFLPWSAIDRWEVMPAMGTPHGQHVLHIGPEAPGRRVGVVRVPALRARDAELLAFARVRLHCPVEVRDGVTI